MNRHRLPWDDLPLALHAEIESVLGARVTSTASGTGGYSPSFADPPGLPTLRAFQRAQAEVALRWLRTTLAGAAEQ